MKQFFLSKNNPTQYYITRTGQVWDSLKEQYLPIYFRKQRKVVRLCGSTLLLHRLVAEYFLPNPLEYTTVTFKTSDKQDCSVENLRWGHLSEKEGIPIVLDGRETYFTIDEDGEVFNRNTGKYVKNKYYKGNVLNIQFNFFKKSYERPIYSLYAEAFKIPREEAYEKFAKKMIAIPAPIIKDIEEAVIFLNGKPSIYKIHKNGIVMNTQTDNILNGSVDPNGYIRVKLEKSHYAVHRLVAEAFIENPNKFQFVDHIDSNRENNKVDNLRWVTKEMNNQAHLNKRRKIKTEMPKGGKDEVWKDYYQYKVSNYGRVKNTKTDKLLKGSLTKAGYRSYNLTLNNQMKSVLAHRLVIEVFEGNIEKDLVINHKNGQKDDNRLVNLEKITQSENVTKAIYDTESFVKWGRVAMYDKEYNLLRTFTTSLEAEKETGIPSGTIRSAITKGNLCRDKYYWGKIES